MHLEERLTVSQSVSLSGKQSVRQSVGQAGRQTETHSLGFCSGRLGYEQREKLTLTEQAIVEWQCSRPTARRPTVRIPLGRPPAAAADLSTLPKLTPVQTLLSRALLTLPPLPKNHIQFPGQAGRQTETHSLGFCSGRLGYEQREKLTLTEQAIVEWQCSRPTARRPTVRIPLGRPPAAAADLSTLPKLTPVQTLLSRALLTLPPLPKNHIQFPGQAGRQTETHSLGFCSGRLGYEQREKLTLTEQAIVEWQCSRPTARRPTVRIPLGRPPAAAADLSTLPKLTPVQTLLSRALLTLPPLPKNHIQFPGIEASESKNPLGDRLIGQNNDFTRGWTSCLGVSYANDPPKGGSYDARTCT